MEQKIYERLIESLHDGIYCVDMDKKITFWNKAAERITGYRRQEVIGSVCTGRTLRHTDREGTELCHNCLVEQSLHDGKVGESDGYLYHKQGFRVAVSTRVSPIFDDQHNIIGAVEIFSDNSQRIEILRELEEVKEEVLIDELTNIGNRTFGEMTLTSYLEEWQASHLVFGILLIAIDNLQQLVATHGNDIGDDILMMVASTLSDGLRKMDVVARWGEEVFVVIIANLDHATLQGIAERLRSLVEKSWLLYADIEQIGLTVSIGGAMIRQDDTLAELIEKAEQNLKKSKEAGRIYVAIDTA